jgi:hypothetical protein
MSTLMVWPHYEVQPIESMHQVREHFTDPCNYELNWLFLSTSGVHGSYTTLDNLENDSEYADWDTITVLIICPRLVVMKYGELSVSRDDIPWLRSIVTRSIAGIAKSQAGNRLD